MSNDLGDETHFENFEGETQASRHRLDCDTRFPKMIKVYSRVMRYIVEKALTKAQQLLEANPLLHSDEVMHMAAGVPHPLMGHATDVQMDAVREEFRGADTPEPVHLISQGGVTIQPDPPTEGVKGTITVSETDGKTSATVNVESPKKSTKKTKEK